MSECIPCLFQSINPIFYHCSPHEPLWIPLEERHDPQTGRADTVAQSPYYLIAMVECFFFLPFIWIKEVIFHRRSRLWSSFILIVIRHTALQSVYVILYMLCAPTNVFDICVITQDGGGGVHSLNVIEISRTFLWNTWHLIHSLHRVTSALQGPFSYGTKWWLGEASLGKSISSFFFPNAAASGQCYLPWFYIWLHKRVMFAQWGFSNNNLDFWGI